MEAVDGRHPEDATYSGCIAWFGNTVRKEVKLFCRVITEDCFET